MSVPRLVAIAHREPRPTIATAESARFWALPWIQQHVHRWQVVGSYALCATCPSVVAPADSRDEIRGGRDAE